MLNDRSKYQYVCTEVYTKREKTLRKVLNYLFHTENRIINVLIVLRNKTEISNEQYKDFSPSGSKVCMV